MTTFLFSRCWLSLFAFQHSFMATTKSAGICAHRTNSRAVSLHIAECHSSPTRKAAGSNPVGRTTKRPLCVHAAVFLYGFWFAPHCVTNQIIYNMIWQGCLSVDFLFLQTRPKFAVWGGFRFHGMFLRPYLIRRDTGRLPATRVLLFSQPHRFAEFLSGKTLVFIKGMAVDVQGGAGLGVTQQARHRSNIHALGDEHAGIGVPLRYNYDKPEKPRRIKGFEVFSLIFSSFSKPKNHTEISRIAGGVSLTTNE